MKNVCVIVSKRGGPEVLHLVEQEAPEPGPGEVRIQVRAAGVGFPDVLMRQGLYPGTPRPPFVPGYDVVGIVEKVGPGVTTVSAGQRVAALTVRGGYSQFLCWKADDLTPVPDGVDDAKAVSLVLNYVTAYQMLHRVAQVRAGQSVLIHGAAGGVGSALVQLAGVAGVAAFGTASTAKQQTVRAMGATPIDYRTEDFIRRVRELTGGAGVDAAFDAVGGRNFTRSYRTLRKGGRLVAYGFSSVVGRRGGALAAVPSFLRLALLTLLPDGKRVSFYGLPQLKAKHPQWFREDLTHLFGLLAKGAIDPVLAAALPLGEAATAHAMLDKQQAMGKIVLLPSTG